MSARENREAEDTYEPASVGTCSQTSPCGCRVGLLSDVKGLPARQAIHMGSLVNPWIVIHCARHTDANESS